MTAREVELSGGAPWGFRMHGGADQNQPLRISRVNPGRKASLSGIREGDVISSINGRPTKGMSNADAHAMLRTAGPMLRLGLNEDKALSPRRRSIGKGSELKRPLQLIADEPSGRATPQAPVYATIRPSQLPHSRLPSSARASLNSLPAALSSTPLVKSVAQNEEPLRFHPTNPFYTTLPSNYSSASKLPVPNGKPSLSSLDRSKLKDPPSYNDYGSDLKSPSFFTQTYDFGPTSLPYDSHNYANKTNGYDSYTEPLTTNYVSDHKSHANNIDKNQSLPKDTHSHTKNPFDTKRNSDPFEKYLRPDSKLNGKCEYEGRTMPSSISDSNFHSNEEITERSTITEHKISEVEEVKTVKKIVLNGYDDTGDTRSEKTFKLERPPINKSNINGSHSQQTHFASDFSSLSRQSPKNERVLSTPVQERNDYFNTFNRDERSFGSASGVYESAHEENRSAKAPASEVVAKPPVKSPSTPPAAAVHSPTSKRE